MIARQYIVKSQIYVYHAIQGKAMHYISLDSLNSDALCYSLAEEKFERGNDPSSGTAANQRAPS